MCKYRITLLKGIKMKGKVIIIGGLVIVGGLICLKLINSTPIKNSTLDSSVKQESNKGNIPKSSELPKSNTGVKSSQGIKITDSSVLVNHKVSGAKDLGSTLRIATVDTEIIEVPKVLPVQVLKVIDGDTFQVTNPIINVPLGNTTAKKGDLIYALKIRMLYSDTPETVKPNVEPQCYGKLVSDWTKDKLENKTVFIAFDKGPIDVKYQRALGFVFEKESDAIAYLKTPTDENVKKSLNFEIVKSGKGRLTAYSPNTQFKKVFQAAEDEAKKTKSGVWSCPKPFEK